MPDGPGGPELERCAWVGNDPLMLAYHDTEWGVPVRDERKLFEFMVLDTFQAGLSWRIILHKRLGLEAAFAQFDAETVAGFGPADVERLMQDSGIIRNRQKIAGTIVNAQLVVAMHERGETLADQLWRFVEGRPLVNAFTAEDQIPATSPEGDAMSVGLRKLGFKFVGPTVCYAFMQGAGLVNDHLVSCFRHAQVQGIL